MKLKKPVSNVVVVVDAEEIYAHPSAGVMISKDDPAYNQWYVQFRLLGKGHAVFGDLGGHKHGTIKVRLQRPMFSHHMRISRIDFGQGWERPVFLQ